MKKNGESLNKELMIIANQADELYKKVYEDKELSENYKLLIRLILTKLIVSKQKGNDVNNNDELRNLEIGIIYFLRGTIEGAIKYFEKAANEQNSPTALLLLGIIRASSDMGVEQNFEKTLEYLERIMDIKGNDIMLAECKYLAYLNAAEMCLYGVGVDVNYQKAREYLEELAVYGFPEALHDLGDIYCNGLGVDVDYQKAKECYEKSTKQKNYKAAYKLGMMYLNAQGVEKSYEKAIEYLKLAWRHGEIEAGYALSIVYRSDEVNDLSQTVKYLERVIKSAAYLDAKGQKYDIDALGSAYGDLGYMYASGLYYQRDWGKAAEYFNKGADLGSAIAQYHVGYIYSHGLGVEMDLDKSREYYKMSAMQGFPPAQFWFGNMCKHGRGGAQNFDSAIYWYKQAAEQGEARASLALANMYTVGKRVEQDREKAKEYFAKSRI